MAKLKIGTVGYVNMGEWNSEIIYNKLKVVTYEGSSYASLIDNNIGNIPTDKNYWQLMASKGDKGDKGEGVAVQTEEPIEEDIFMWYDIDDDEDNYVNLEEIIEITNNLKEVAPLTNLEIEEIINKIL